MASHFSLSARIQGRSSATYGAGTRVYRRWRFPRHLGRALGGSFDVGAHRGVTGRDFFVGVFETLWKLFRIWDSWRREFRRS
jgi:hypothetical protein